MNYNIHVYLFFSKIALLTKIPHARGKQHPIFHYIREILDRSAIRPLVTAVILNWILCVINWTFIYRCNKVTCGYCQRSMCWACGVDITMESYGHFDKCALSEMDPFIANDFYKDGRIENDFYGDGGNVTVPRFRRQIIQRNPVTRLFTFKLSNALIKIKLCYLSS